jgi:hypothetical protein
MNLNTAVQFASFVALLLPIFLLVWSQFDDGYGVFKKVFVAIDPSLDGPKLI